MRRLLFTTLVAALGVSAPQMVAFANDTDRHDSQAKSNPSNAEQHQAASNNSKSDNNSNTAAKSNSDSQNNNRSSHNDDAAKSSTDRNQDNDRNEDRDNSSRDSDQSSNRGHENGRDNQKDSDRSLRNNQDRDDNDRNNDRKSYDRSHDDNSKADNNRSGSHTDRQHNYKQDFKFGRSNDHGLTLSTVTQRSVFYKGGLRDNDVIVSYNGHRIHNESDFGRYVIYEKGRVPVVVYRNGHEQTIYVVFDDQDDVARSSGDTISLFGAEFDHRSNNGAVIVRVEDDSPADRAGLRRDDVVTAINGDRVSSGRDAERILGSLDAGQRVEVEYKQPGRNRSSHAQVTLGSADRDTNVEKTSYQTNYAPSVATGVQADGTHRDSDRDRHENNQDRREDRHDNRGGLLPRLRN